MTIIVRRPHAYRFLEDVFEHEGGIESATPAGCVTAEGTLAPLPGFYFLDASGAFLSSTPLTNAGEVAAAMKNPGESADGDAAIGSKALEQTSIRVSGFVQAEGIT